MSPQDKITLFEESKVRTAWDETTETWYFSVVDVVAVLTQSVNPTDYIKKLKKRDPILAEGWGQIVTPPFDSNVRWQTESQLREPRGNVQNNPIDSVAEGRTV